MTHIEAAMIDAGVRIADRRRALAGLVLVAAFGWSLLTVELVNDHFDRISRGRQILIYGEQPFVDFRDPGYFLTLYASAAAQAVTRGSLLGEAVIDSAGIAAAVALTFLLAARAARSVRIGLVAALFTIVVAPRYYDYDKVLFYTSGLAAAWRYVDRRDLSTLIVAAVVTAVAGMFRYDNGIFLLVAALTALFVCHWRQPGMLVRRGCAYVAGVALVLAPAAIVWHQTIGVSEVFRQIQTYAQVEGGRTGIFRLPTLRVDTGFPAVLALVNPENRAALLFYAIVALLPIASACLAWRTSRAGRDRGLADATPKIAAAIVLGVLVAVFILRDPLVARLGAAAPIAAILAAWIAGPMVPSRGAEYYARSLVIVLGGLVALNVAMVLTGRSPVDLLRAPQVAAAGAARIRQLPRMPPSLSLLPDAPTTEGMVAYVRACTPPGSRVFAGGFVPQLYFFAERGFAGGMPVSFGGHWSAARDQERTIERLQREFVPLAIIDADFAVTYDRVNAYIASVFALSGTSSFGNPRAPAGGYHVFWRRDVGPTTGDRRWNLPCLSDWTHKE